MKSFLLLAFLFIISFSLSQKVEGEKSLLSSFSKLRVGIEVAAFRGLTLNHENGSEILRSYSLPSPIINLGYPITINENWILSFGASMGYAPINLTYKTLDLNNHTVYNGNGEQFDLEVNEFDAIYLGTGFVSLNLNILKYFEFSKNNNFILGGGFSIARGIRDLSIGGSFGQNEQVVDNGTLSYKIFESYIDQDTLSLPWKLAVQMSLGRKFRKRIEMFININYSLKPLFSGTYYFYNLGFSSNGEYRKDLSYIGLKMIYSLPFKKQEK